jgi:hypothetical protein
MDSSKFEEYVKNNTLSTVAATHIDMLNLFNWEKIASITTDSVNPGVFRYLDQYQNTNEFTFAKKINTVAAFNNILRTILGPTSNLRTIIRIFRNLKIIDESNGSTEADSSKSDKMIKIMDDDETNTKVTSLHTFLTGVKQYTSDPDTTDSPEELPLNVDPKICAKFPKCSEYDNMFANCWLLRTPGFDFFGRRVKTEKTVYIGTSTYDKKTEYKDSNIVVWHTYYQHTIPVKLISYSYTNGADVTNLNSMFSNCKFGNGYTGATENRDNMLKDIANAPCFNLKQFFVDYNIGNDITDFDEYYINNIKGKTFNDFNLVHSLGTHIENNGNILYAVPATEDELKEKTDGTSSAIWADDENIVVEYPNERITSYDQLYLNYWSDKQSDSGWDTTTAGMQTASMSYEISDMLGVETHYIEKFMTSSDNAAELSNWYINICCENQLFISPDFFKAMTNQTRRVASIFNANNLTSTDDITKTLTGAVPKHLFTLSNSSSLTDCGSIFYNLNILPQYVDDINGYTKTGGIAVKSEKVYTYYPAGLFSFHSGSLDLAFKSKLFMPPAINYNSYSAEAGEGLDIDIVWYVFFVNSTLSKNISSLTNSTTISAFPESGYNDGKFSNASG